MAASTKAIWVSLILAAFEFRPVEALFGDCPSCTPVTIANGKTGNSYCQSGQYCDPQFVAQLNACEIGCNHKYYKQLIYKSGLSWLTADSLKCQSGSYYANGKVVKPTQVNCQFVPTCDECAFQEAPQSMCTPGWVCDGKPIVSKDPIDNCTTVVCPNGYRGQINPESLFTVGIWQPLKCSTLQFNWYYGFNEKYYSNPVIQCMYKGNTTSSTTTSSTTSTTTTTTTTTTTMTPPANPVCPFPGEITESLPTEYVIKTKTMLFNTTHAWCSADEAFVAGYLNGSANVHFDWLVGTALTCDQTTKQWKDSRGTWSTATEARLMCAKWRCPMPANTPCDMPPEKCSSDTPGAFDFATGEIRCPATSTLYTARTDSIGNDALYRWAGGVRCMENGLWRTTSDPTPREYKHDSFKMICGVAPPASPTYAGCDAPPSPPLLSSCPGSSCTSIANATYVTYLACKGLECPDGAQRIAVEGATGTGTHIGIETETTYRLFNGNQADLGVFPSTTPAACVTPA